MLKLIATTSLVAATALPASAGNLLFEAPVDQQVVTQEEEPIGATRLGWVIPLIAIGAIALVAASGDDDDDDGGTAQDDGGKFTPG